MWLGYSRRWQGEAADGNRRSLDAITLVISDTGSGLPQKVLAWFNKSDRSDAASQDIETIVNGIGLVIVKELAEILKVEIKANLESGTQFSITFLENGTEENQS